MFTEEDNILIRKEFEVLKEASRRRCANEEQFQLVLKAFDFANEAHYGVRRRSGEPYILHPIAVAKIVVQEISLGCKSICAALLHDVVEDTSYTVDDIRNLFGDRIALLVDGLTKLKSTLDNDHISTTATLQAENFRRILLTLNDDTRIVLIKMADRLHNVRTIQYMPEYKREKILSETMYIFIPLAHRLGLYDIKSEMENIWLSFKEPNIYTSISRRLESVIAEKGDIIDRFIEPISNTLSNAGYKFRIVKRVKTPYSIWRKMMTKNVTFDEIYDLYAVRIIFEPKQIEGLDERDQCWQIFNRITSRYKHKPERTRDWISSPKTNGYEALHLTVMFLGTWIEVQIRSERMNAIAERGLAAHWAYKSANPEANQAENGMDRWLKQVQDILDNPDANALQALDNFHEEMLSSEIYIFTPDGETRTLPKGATALDFAYSIHSHIGNTAIAAKVNKKLVPLSQELFSGDQVEIITSMNSKPKREWLQFLKTTRAKNQVFNALRGDTRNNIKEGMHILEQALAKREIPVNPRVIRKLVDFYKAEGGKDDLYNKIGMGIVDLSDIDIALNTNLKERNVQMWGFKLLNPISSIAKINKKEEYLLQENVDEGTISFKTLPCCNPVPGDNVIGIINDDGSVTIHKTSCQEYTNYAATHGDRIVAVKWSKHFVMSYLTSISIRGIDRIGILNEITKVITLMLGINIRYITINAHDDIFEGRIDLYVHHTSDIDRLMNDLSKIRGLEKVTRTEVN